MAKTASKARRTGRTTSRVLDRQSKPAKLVSARYFTENAGEVMRDVSRHGAVAISKNRKPVAVALAPDVFLKLCVDYALRNALSGDRAF